MNQAPEAIGIERSEREILVDIIRLAPKVTDYYRQEGAEEQKAAFLAEDEIRATNHGYPLLMDADFGPKIDELLHIRSEIVDASGINEKFLPHYLNLVGENVNKYRMLKLVHEYHLATDAARKTEIREQYLALNQELYGAPQREIFDSIVSDTYDRFESAQLVGDAVNVRAEIFAMLAKPEGAKERFRPSRETVQWLGQVVDALYGNLLQHVPAPTEDEIVSGENHQFTPGEVKRIFEEIIREEFGKSAAEWSVVYVKTGPIEVDRINKRINIPENRRPASRNELRGLVVHELGVHFLRGVMGYEMDNPIHALGFRNYRLLEEGAGVANQQALQGEYADSGDNYYLVASLMELEGKDKRDTFELMWRYFALKRIGKDGVLDEKAITAARESAYSCIDRMTKGMDDTPSNMDLSYYIGSDIAWRYYEKNVGDPEAINRFFMSRLNTNDTAELSLALDAHQLSEAAAA